MKGLKSCGPIADKKSQNPSKIGLKGCGSAKVCYTRPKVAPPSVVQKSSEPVTGGGQESSQLAGQEQPAAQARQNLAGWLEEGKKKWSNWISSSEVLAVTSCAEAAVKVKKSTQCRVSYVKIDRKAKHKQSCKIIKTKLFQHPASSGNEANPGDRGQRGRGIGERKIVPRGDPAIRNVPPPAASRREQLLCGDHLWSKTGLSETGGGDLRRDRSERSSNQTSRPKSAQGHLKHEVNSPSTRLGVNNHNGGASPPLTGQQDD